eukprot:s1324_g18.t1
MVQVAQGNLSTVRHRQTSPRNRGGESCFFADSPRGSLQTEDPGNHCHQSRSPISLGDSVVGSVVDPPWMDCLVPSAETGRMLWTLPVGGQFNLRRISTETAEGLVQKSPKPITLQQLVFDLVSTGSMY